MRNTIQASALVSAMFILFSIGAIADTTMTCTRGNTNMQDYPLEVLEDESTCGDNQSCVILMINRNNDKRARNNQIAIKNSQLASLRAQCDQKFSEQDKQAADQAAAKNKESSDKQNQAMQDMVKSLAGNNNGNNNNNNNSNGNNGNNNNGNNNSESNGGSSGGSGDQAGGSGSGGSGASGLDEKGNDKKGEGNKEAKQGIEGAIQKMVSLQTSNASQLTGLLQKYVANRDSCISSQGTASEVCLEETSPSILQGAMAINPIVGTMSVGANANQSMQGAAEGLQAANIAMTGFIGACSAANALCKSSCTSAKESLTSLKSAGSSATCSDPNNTTCTSGLASAKSELSQSVSKEEKASDKTSIAGKEKLCKDKYSKTLASALQGLAQILAALMAAKQNEADTAAANGVIPTVTATADCSDPAKAQTTECLCLINPRLTGCNNGLAGAASTNGGLSSDPGSLSSLGAGDTTLPTAKNAMELQPLNKDGSGGSAPGGSAGGGAGIGGGSSGFGGQAAKDAAAAGNKPLDANILAGTSGGGGGGGWGGFGGGDKYKDYLPGGKRDPASKAAAAAIAAQVSGAGGKSNWEKVKDRYRDNKGTLLNNN